MERAMPDSSLQHTTAHPTANQASGPITVLPGACDRFDLGGFGIHWKIDGFHTGERFSIVHHPLAPRALAAPLHRHHREDEYSYVLSGNLGALLGDDVVTAGPGTWVFKPRGQWHTFWNAGDRQCEIIEVISPAGFEDYFRELAAIWPDRTKSGELLRKYELDMDFESVPDLCARFGLTSARPAAAAAPPRG
ncbi:cupin domain-containing protein [Mesorhizobium sp. M1322]|uniref:cupin domain-containing protein n=1 Tax=Mesorhizobium sp. M1322 TaxID=2957081 RepID=UPI0033375A84